MDESYLQCDEVAIIKVFVKNIFSVTLLWIKCMEELSIWQRKSFDIRLCSDCEDRKLLPQGLYKESSVTFEDEDLRDVCQMFYDFASVAVRSKVKRHLYKSIHKMQNELQRLEDIARRDRDKKNPNFYLLI